MSTMVETTENRKLIDSGLFWLWITVLVVALDQVTKVIAENSMTLYESVPVMPYFNFTLAYNAGAAFSFLADASGWQRWLFAVIAVVVSVFITGWLFRLRREQKWLGVSLALILGGAIGNVWDRITLGHVIDFIDVYYQDWHWPAFNIADSAICVGAAMLVIESLFFHGKDKA